MTLRLRNGRVPVSGFGDRLQAAARLVRLGARATVVNDALAIDGPARSLVRRLYRGVRTNGRPRGPLPFDHAELLGSASARLDAAVFLQAWQRLRAAGVDRAGALEQAWTCLADARGAAVAAGRRPGIDQCWVLARALEEGALQRVACGACGTAYFDVRLRARRPGEPATPLRARQASQPAHLRCPHCAALRAGGSGASCDRLPRAPDRPSPAPVLHPVDELAARYAWAEALFREGARPPIVTHVTGLAMTGTLRQLYIEVVGHGPRQGALPQLGEHIIATYARKLQSSVVVVTADRLVRAGCAPAATLLATWRSYRALFGASARFDINAVALVLRARNHPDFALVPCRGCGSAYLELRLDAGGGRCPVCRQLRLAQAEAAWT